MVLIPFFKFVTVWIRWPYKTDDRYLHFYCVVTLNALLCYLRFSWLWWGCSQRPLECTWWSWSQWCRMSCWLCKKVWNEKKKYLVIATNVWTPTSTHFSLERNQKARHWVNNWIVVLLQFQDISKGLFTLAISFASLQMAIAKKNRCEPSIHSSYFNGKIFWIKPVEQEMGAF